MAELPRQVPTPLSASTKRASSTTGSLAALSYPAFRLYWISQLISVSGTWMQATAQQVVVYQLTGAELALGLTAFAQGIPAIVLTPVAGVLAERYSRRKLMILAQVLMMVLAFTLAALQFTGLLQVWHIVVISFLGGFANAMDAPARQALVVEMVGHDALPSGLALNSIMFNSARIIGPMVGGLALRFVGPAWCFMLNGLSFVAVLIGLMIMRLTPTVRRTGKVEIWRPLVEAVRFARAHAIIGPLLLLAVVNSCFGLSFATQFASYAQHVLNNVTEGTSALLTAQGIGTVIASLTITRMANSGKRGLLLTIMCIVSPLALMAMTFISDYWLALVLCSVAGGGVLAQFIVSNISIQNAVPDNFRGRIMSLYTVTFFGIGPFANIVLGALAQVLGVTAALLIFGVCGLLLNAMLVLPRPALRRLP
jgi:MFS family permease